MSNADSRWALLLGGVVGACLVGFANAYFSSLTEALAEERSLLEAARAREAKAHHAAHHGRHHSVKHHHGGGKAAVQGGTPLKTKHARRRTEANSSAGGSSEDDEGGEALGGGSSWHSVRAASPPPRLGSPKPAGARANEGGSPPRRAGSLSRTSSQLLNPDFQGRVRADEALPSARAAAAAGAAEELPGEEQAASASFVARFEAVSDTEAEAELEAAFGEAEAEGEGTQTEAEEAAARRRRATQAAIARRLSDASLKGCESGNEGSATDSAAATPRRSRLQPPSPAPSPAPAAAPAYPTPGRAAPSSEYDRVVTPEAVLTGETEEVCALLAEALQLRVRYAIPEPAPGRGPPRFAPGSKQDPFRVDVAALPPHSGHAAALRDGVFAVWPSAEAAAAGGASLFPVPGSATDFFSDLHHLCRLAASGPAKSFCHRRLNLLDQRFQLHLMLNSDREYLAQKAAPHRDFYNVRKVDTHVHHSACMNQKHLLRFMKSRLRREADGVVIFRDGKYLTLADVFRSLHLTSYELNVDTMDMHADKDTFHRFDRFNLKYNPCGESRLREIFMKQDNLIRGRFLAELTQEVFSDLEANKYQHAEYRISIYGRKKTEWDTLASWVCNHGLYSDNVVWLIQLPRLYSVYKANGTVANFGELLDNVFAPLFEVTIDPASHPQLHVFLQTVVGFDMVDDESKPERRPSKHMRTPEEWDLVHEPAYAYWAYYVWVNLYALNGLRAARGLGHIAFRPHAGEAGDVDHLAAAFLLAKNIAHGINLRKTPVLQHLFYLAQIGLNLSPLSNNRLFLDYHRNPFPLFFARGLPVSLSTDDPLQIHLTKEPLVEEYSVAAQVWKFSHTDLCEIARTSVLNSGFSHADKCHWVSDTYWKAGAQGNDATKTNVADVRLRFRHDTLLAERMLVQHGAERAEARFASRGARRFSVV